MNADPERTLWEGAGIRVTQAEYREVVALYIRRYGYYNSELREQHRELLDEWMTRNSQVRKPQPSFL